eukprot:2942058-Pyramimonas_sp.AAC.1
MVGNTTALKFLAERREAESQGNALGNGLPDNGRPALPRQCTTSSTLAARGESPFLFPLQMRGNGARGDMHVAQHAHAAEARHGQRREMRPSCKVVRDYQGRWGRAAIPISYSAPAADLARHWSRRSVLRTGGLLGV